MIDESNLFNFYCSGIYDSSKALTQTEIIMKVLEKLNLVILNFNNLETQTLNNMKKLEKQIDYYLDTGMKVEVEKNIEQMKNDGTLSSIINDELLYDINNQVSINTEDIKTLKQQINSNGGLITYVWNFNRRKSYFTCSLYYRFKRHRARHGKKIWYFKINST